MKGRLALAENQMDKAVDTLDMVSELFFLYVCAYLSACMHARACVCACCVISEQELFPTSFWNIVWIHTNLIVYWYKIHIEIIQMGVCIFTHNMFTLGHNLQEIIKTCVCILAQTMVTLVHNLQEIGWWMRCALLADEWDAQHKYSIFLCLREREKGWELNKGL